MDVSSGEESHQFLKGIERRHDELLDQLEQLNGQIEQVLGEYLGSREQDGLANSDANSGMSSEV